MDKRLKNLVLVWIVSIVLFIGNVVNAEVIDLSKKIGVGVGYPYISAKYGVNRRITGELRCAFSGGINVFSGRGYYNFYVGTKLIGFAGAEIGYILFDTEGIKGNGYLVLPFVGGEYFIISPRFSVGLDFGPAFISLRSTELGKVFTVDGIEWIFNLGINYYF